MTSRMRLISKALAITCVMTSSAVAQGGAGWPSWSEAIKKTQQSGTPTVLVVISQNVPSSGAFARALAGEVSERPAGAVQFVEFSVEANPEVSKRLGIVGVPTLLLYRRGASGLELAARTTTVSDPATAIGWVDGLTNANTAEFASRDSALMRAGHHHQQPVVQPSGQGQYTTSSPVGNPSPIGNPPQMQVTPQQVVMQSTPTVMTPVTGPQPTPIVVQAQNPPVILQQAPMHVMVGPAPAPVVTFVQGASTPPQVNVAMLQAQQPQQNNLFVQSPGPPAIGNPPSIASPQGSYVQSSGPQQPVMQAQMSQPQYVQAPLQSQFVQAQGGPASGGALLLHQPGIVGRTLGGIGKLLTPFGNPRLTMSPVTPVTMAVPQAMLIQGQQPQGQLVAAPPPQFQQGVQYGPSYQQPVSATPQSGDGGHHGFRLFHHKR